MSSLSSTQPDPSNVTVKVLKATRKPSRHCRMVRANIDPESKLLGYSKSGHNSGQEAVGHHKLLFDPQVKQRTPGGVVGTTCLVSPKDDGTFIMSIENHNCFPVQMEEGQLLGTLIPVQSSRKVTVVEKVCKLQTTEGTDDLSRLNELLKQLDVANDLSPIEEKKVFEVVSEFSDVFAVNAEELGHTELVQHTINTGDHPPIKQLPHRTPFALKGQIEQMIAKMLEQGVITPSSSPWASPVVLVAKKDGSTRFCVDYRRLNSITRMDTYPLPRIDDTLDLLAKTKFFSTLDLASGYWQVGMEASLQPKTAFCAHSGLYEFTVMPFGLCNAPATFQRLMETVLSGLAREKCFIYLDDVLVVGITFEEHANNLREVLTPIREAGLRLKPSKCHLAKSKVTYLGYVVSKEGVTVDPDKVAAIQKFPTPASVKELRSFLGLASYYRRFIPGFSKVASPLFALTHKGREFAWSQECEDVFKKMKSLLSTAPLLVFPDFSKEFVLETDASGLGLGAILSQQQDNKVVAPISYASRTLQKHEQNYGVTELEALGVVWAVKHFHPYLYGHKCLVITDHEALKSLLNTPHPSGKLARWGLAIQELDLVIQYRPGKKNQSADALPRMPAISQESVLAKDGEGMVSALVCDNGERGLGTKQDDDPNLKPIRHYLKANELPSDERIARELVLSRPQFEIIDVLYHVELDKTLRVIPTVAQRRKLFEDTHSGLFGGHLRSAKIHSQLAKHFWWPTMRTDIFQWCRACQVCATRQVGKPIHPFLSLIPVSGPFDRVGVDMVQFPPSSKGNKYAIVFMDYLTKWFPSKNQNSPTIARLLVEHIIPCHGVPVQVYII